MRVDGTGPLTAADAFSIAVEEALRDGRMDAEERELLLALRKELGLSADEGKELARRATAVAGAREEAAEARLDRARVVERVAVLVNRDPTPEARGVLAAVRKALEVEDEAPEPAAREPVLGNAPARRPVPEDDSAPAAAGDPARWGLGKILGLTGGIMLAHAGYWAGLAGAVGLSSGLLYLLVGKYLPTVMAPILAPLLTIFVLGAMTDLARRGEAPTLAGVWGRWKGRLKEIVGTQILMIAVLPAAIALAGGAVGFAVSAGVGMVLGATLGGYAGSLAGGLTSLGLLARLVMASPFALNEVLAEREAPLPALASAEDLTRRNPTGVVGLWVPTAIVASAAPWAFASLLVWLATVVPAGGWLETIFFSYLWPLQVACAAMTMGVVEATGIAWTLFYLREKARRLEALPGEARREPILLDADDDDEE